MVNLRRVAVVSVPQDLSRTAALTTTSHFEGFVGQSGKAFMSLAQQNFF